MTVVVTRRAFLFSSVLAGCASATGRREVPANRGPLRLAVGTIVAGEGPPPLPAANFIDERRSRDLVRALRERLAQRLLAAGGAATLEIAFEQAALTERLIEGRVGGVGGLVAREPTHAFEGALAVGLRVVDAAGREAARVRVAVQRSRSLPAGSSVAAREDAARALAGDLLEQFDRALESAVREQLAPWLV
ncbi:MAG: hypothetical protein N2038_00795 [Geminicoccaceae bacterium]|nr:hypothetical protein [Geminicoccaceae bacterium]MCX7628767.1 hypothetical protein [Geminicoccaceae bacterium]MDW8123373.1 hypothetical protein [Geminicoccaceae bacterium]